MPVMSPTEVVAAVPAGVGRLVAGGLTAEEREAQIDALADLYAEQTDVRHPLAPTGTRWSHPLRTRDEVRAHFATAEQTIEGAERFEPVDVVVHTTGDPEIVIIEFTYEGSAGGRAIDVPCIFVTRVRDGRIVESRDYAAHGVATSP